ncbi:hypothetical protein RhiJN_13218 [Ceratobasidium sp. AG-Ba]|nr:hypothetical protein RhiJN_13218 [Ceratobasidium sp. AG-Ba]
MLATLSSDRSIDILSPSGELVLNRSKDPTPVTIAASYTNQTIESGNQHIESMPVDPSHLDLEDLAGAEIAKETPGSPSPYLTLANGELIHKARAISQVFFNSKRNSTDRLSQVAGLSKYSVSTTNPDVCNIIDHETALGEPALHVNDPAAALVRCGTHIFLALLQVNRLQFDGLSVLEMTSTRLCEKPANATAQVLCLSSCNMPPTSNGEAIEIIFLCIYKMRNKMVLKA